MFPWQRQSLRSIEKSTGEFFLPLERKACEDVSGRWRASVLSGLTYALGTFISSGIVMGIMLINAGSSSYKYDQDTCSCDCFDRRFKENHFAATKQYRHIYFNMTANTALAFLWSAFHLTMLLAYVDRALNCLCVTLGFEFRESFGKLRWFALCCSSINFYGLVYGWWVMFNYINDAKHWSDMGNLWPTQLFFSVTDFLPAYAGYVLLAQGSTLPDKILESSLSVSVSHILLALWDQGAAHILTLHSLAARDAMFFISDLAGVFCIIPYIDIRPDTWRKITVGVMFLSCFYLSLKTYFGSD